ncbi:GerAB/ArcD/ProY family transporter [Bacillus cereus]
MKENKQEITLFQMFLFIIQTVTGIGVLTLPYDMYKVSKEDSWISILIGGTLISMGIFIIWLLLKRFPGSTIFELSTKISGEYLGAFIKVSYIFFFLYTSVHLSLLFGRLVSIWVLPRTPIWITIFLILSVGVYCATKNLKIIARFFTVVSVLAFVLFLLITYIVKDIDIHYILPIGQNGIHTILKGALTGSLAFAGFETILIIFPYTKGKSIHKFHISLLALISMTLFYAYITFICITFFGPAVMKLVPQPLLYILKYQSFQVIERTDLLFFSIWTVSVATSIMSYLYVASIGLANLLRHDRHSTFVPYAAMLVFIVTLLIPQNEKYINLVSRFYGLLSPIFLFGIPGLLLIFSLFLKKADIQGGSQS